MASDDMVTGLDILHAVQLDASESASLTGRYGQDVERYVRKAYWKLLARERWPWAMASSPGIITTEAKLDITVNSISSATPAVVTASANITASQVGKKFYMEGNQSVYRITAHTGGTALLTLDAKYVETETAGAAILYQDEYQLPTDVLKVWDPMGIRGTRYDLIRLLDKPRFEEIYGRGSWSLGFGPIESAMESHPDAYDATAKGVIRRVRFAPWSEEAVNIEFDYTQFHDLDFTGTGAGDTPRIPRENRSVLIDLAAFELFVAKDDNRADQAITKASAQIQDMINQYIPAQDGRVWVQHKHSAALGCN